MSDEVKVTEPVMPPPLPGDGDGPPREELARTVNGHPIEQHSAVQNPVAVAEAPLGDAPEAEQPPSDHESSGFPEDLAASEKMPLVADIHQEPEHSDADADDLGDLAEEEEVEAQPAAVSAAPVSATPVQVAEPEPEEKHEKHWYVVKVQSGREDTIKDAIERRVRKEGLEEYFGQIVIPVEKYTEVKVDKNGRRVPKTKERKLFPGYLMVEVEYNDRIVYLFRETSGVGDFVGAHPGDLMKPPTPMSDREVQRMLGPAGQKAEEKGGAQVARPPEWLQEGDRVRVVDGTFNGMDGIVRQILEPVSKVQVELSIFGRPVNVDFEYYQVEQV